MLAAFCSIAGWIACNLELSFANKHFFDSYPLPFFTLLSHTSISCVVAYTALWVLQRPMRPEVWKPIVIASLLRATEVILETISIVHISISLNQTLKACIPVFVVLLKRQRLNWSEWLGLLLIVIGSVLAVAEGEMVVGQMTGVVSALCSALLAAIYLVYTGEVVLGLDLLEISAYTGLPGIAVLLPCFLLFEVGKLGILSGHWFTTTWFVLSQSTVAFLYSIAGFGVLKYTGPLYMGLIGNVKSIMAVIVDSYLGTKMETTALQGVIITLCGFCLYNVELYLKKKEELQSQAKKELDS